MDTFDKLLEKHYPEKTEKNGLEFLMEMVQDELTSMNYVVEAEGPVKHEKGKQFVLALPKFTPSEAWGNPTSEARKQMDMYFKQMGGGRDIKGKIDYLNRLQEPDTRITSPGRIISSLILLESLASCLSSFGSSSAGFVFEGFLAALLGGRQVAETRGGTLPIEDIMAFQYDEGDPGVPVSLKLLKPGSEIKGSFTNLIEAMNDHGEMIYIVAIKKGGDQVSEISIDQFVITRDNVIDLVALKNPGLLAHDDARYTAEFLNSLPWEERYPVLQQTAGYTKKRKQAPAQQDDREQINEVAKATQWYVTQNLITGLDTYQHIAEIDINPQTLYKTAEQYLDVLGERIQILFGAVRDLSENLNVFFTSEKREEGLARGSEAISNAKVIEKTATEQLEKEKTEKQ